MGGGGHSSADSSSEPHQLPPGVAHAPGPGELCSLVGVRRLQQVEAAVSVRLSQRADAGSVFRGWGGGCSGPGACAVKADADRTVWADFGARRTLTVTVSGSGSVTSAPAGISCPGACSAGFADGA